MTLSATPKRFGVLGSGDVGQVLAKGLAAHGYEVHIGTRTPGKLAAYSNKTGIPEASFKDVASWAIEPLAQVGCIPGFRENDWMHAFRLPRP